MQSKDEAKLQVRTIGLVGVVFVGYVECGGGGDGNVLQLPRLDLTSVVSVRHNTRLYNSKSPVSGNRFCAICHTHLYPWSIGLQKRLVPLRPSRELREQGIYGHVNSEAQ